MPTYYYRCDDCGERCEHECVMSERPDTVTCECGADMYRDFHAEHPVQHSGDGYLRPIVSDSLAMSVSQIEEHRREFPDIKVLPDGRPVFDNFRSHEKYLKKVGVVKHEQKQRRSGTVIA